MDNTDYPIIFHEDDKKIIVKVIKKYVDKNGYISVR